VRRVFRACHRSYHTWASRQRRGRHDTGVQAAREVRLGPRELHGIDDRGRPPAGKVDRSDQEESLSGYREPLRAHWRPREGSMTRLTTATGARRSVGSDGARARPDNGRGKRRLSRGLLRGLQARRARAEAQRILGCGDDGTRGKAVSGESYVSPADLIRPVKQMSRCRPGSSALSSVVCARLKADVHGS
jgi:hypothetical protein